MDRDPTNPHIGAGPSAAGPSLPAATGRPSRRQVLRGAGAGLGAAALAPVVRLTSGAVGTTPRVTARSAGTRSMDFGQGWKFVLVNPEGVTGPTGAYANAPDPGFDDSAWRTVDVPHDWSIELTPAVTPSTSSGTGFLQGGLAWYRKTFTLPPATSGQRISIEFDGVYMNSDVYLNGQLLGNHPYAYTGFGYDLTGKVHTDGKTPNVIAVQVSNQLPSSRWYSGSGIYRNVHLVVTGPVHIARLGTFVTTPGLEATITSGYASVHVETDVANDGTDPADVTIVARVRDARGATVAQATSAVTVAPGQTQRDALDLRVTNPALWSVDRPALYQLQTDVVRGGTDAAGPAAAGTVDSADTVMTEFGIRYFAFDPNAGFSLNGKPMKIQGVDLHATQGPLGATIHYDGLVHQLEIMKSMGVNALRTAHNPPAPELVQVCERLGVLMMVEAFDCWHTGKVTYDYHLYFDASSETSTRGVYADPQLLNTGENYTPGKRGTSCYDNNLASWCMSGEYELKKDRDRQFWQGGFLWSGQDYIGEPTPYDVFPVKTSFFGAVDTAGFGKDAYYLYQSQWAAGPMVHIVPMNWTDHAPGEDVAVWVYSNVATVELFLNGKSLGTKTFDRKVTTDGRAYLETTEPTGDDKNYPTGSYTSPNGSSGKLHLAWNVAFEPGSLTAIATSNGKQVASDEVRTAGQPRAVMLTTGTHTITADGKSVAFLTAEIVDGHGVVVPGAGNLIHLDVNGPGKLAGVDNGREENPQGYQAPQVAAWNGKALAVVASTRQPGTITVTATSPGLAPARAALRSDAAAAPQPAWLAGTAGPAAGAAARAGRQAAGLLTAGAADQTRPAAGLPTADASYSGAPATVPAAMLDGNPATGWSNYYLKSATANLPAVSQSRVGDWVSLSWQAPQRFGTASASFSTNTGLTLPASIAVSYWDGRRFVPVKNLQISWATASNQPTTLTFDPVTSSAVRLDMTSPSPGTSAGFLQITELQVSG